MLPVALEPAGEPTDYGDDRVFVHLQDDTASDEELDAKVAALRDAGHPVVTLTAHGPKDLGRIFFFAEFATAVSGWVLGINPFDQPNVQEAKDNTQQVLDRLTSGEGLQEPPDASDDDLRALVDGLAPPAYLAVLGYLPASPEVDAAVEDLRAAMRARTKVATTYGYGPRYLHSTGQFHKGGPAEGRFLLLVHDPVEDVDVPSAPYTFGQLQRAQAVGDLHTLRRPRAAGGEGHAGRRRPGRVAARAHRAPEEALLMQLGFVGLGKMGGNMVHRIHRDSEHTSSPTTAARRRWPPPRGTARPAPARSRTSSAGLEAPRMVWIMVPAGDPTEQTVQALAKLLEPGDAIVDGGNSKWTDDARRAEQLQRSGSTTSTSASPAASGASRSATA